MVHAIKNKLSKKTVKMIKTSCTFFGEKVYNLHSIVWVFQSRWWIRQKENSRKGLSKQIKLNSDSQQLMIRFLRSYKTKGLLYPLLRRDLLLKTQLCMLSFLTLTTLSATELMKSRLWLPTVVAPSCFHFPWSAGHIEKISRFSDEAFCWKLRG